MSLVFNVTVNINEHADKEKITVYESDLSKTMHLKQLPGSNLKPQDILHVCKNSCFKIIYREFFHL